MLALAYTGFFLNLFNLVPFGFLDGGRIARVVSRKSCTSRPDPRRAHLRSARSLPAECSCSYLRRVTRTGMPPRGESVTPVAGWGGRLPV